MSKNSTYSKNDFLNLLYSEFEHLSSDSEYADEYLTSVGLDPDTIADEGIKQLKRKILAIKIEKTKAEMARAESLKQTVLGQVEKLLLDKTFKFMDFIKTERPQLSFRNLESFTPLEIKDILIQHYTLKLLQEQDKGSTDGL